MRYDFNRIIDRKNTGSLKWGILKKAYNDETIIPLWVADMDFAVPKQVQKAIVKRGKHPIYGYPFRTDEYFNSLIYWYQKRFDLKIDKANVFYSPGVVPAIYLSLLAFTEPQDEIIVQTPVYYPFFQSVQNTKRKLLINRLRLEDNRYYIDFDNLKSIVTEKTKAIIFCSPHNPIGRVWDKEELGQLIDFCKQRDILIISDEIHSDLILSDKRHIPTVKAKKEAENIVITLSAPNKTFNIAGLTSANVIIFNKNLAEKYQKALESLGLGVSNVFSVVAQIEAYYHGENWLNQLIEYLKGNYQYLQKRLEGMKRIKLYPIEATYLAWLDCRQIGDDDQIASFFLKEAKLLLNEGRQFGEGGEGFMRLNFATSRKILRIAMDRLEKAYFNKFKD